MINLLTIFSISENYTVTLKRSENGLFGFSLDGHKIKSIGPSSSAAKSRMRSGDKILRINGKDVSNLASIKTIIKAQFHVIRLTLARNLK